MSKITDSFTIVNVQCSLFTHINFLLVKQVFNDPGSLNYIADFVNYYSNVGSETYRVGIVYKDAEMNGGQEFVLFDRYAYPLHKVIRNVTPVGVGIFLTKDSMILDKYTVELEKLYPSVNFAVSEMNKAKVFKLSRSFFGMTSIPYDDADDMLHNMFKNAYDGARGMLIGIKVHDRPAE